MRCDRRRNIISALQELRSNIARIEQDHPRLGNDLSSTCQRVITELEDIHPPRPDAVTQETIAAGSRSTASNPLARAIDKTATCIISGLDRTGDGIIFIFSKIGRVSK
ncbi:MAG: hypothetical protein WC541_07900 [Dehalococcoidia bacterium]